MAYATSELAAQGQSGKNWAPQGWVTSYLIVLSQGVAESNHFCPGGNRLWLAKGPSRPWVKKYFLFFILTINFIIKLIQWKFCYYNKNFVFFL